MNEKNYFGEIGAWPKHSSHITRAYVIGFVASLALTLVAYSLVAQDMASTSTLTILVMLLALVQFAVQVYCFLHLGAEAGTRDRLITLGFAALIVTILVSGSLWIMFSLNGRMMPDTAQMEQYMNDQSGF